MSEKNTPSEVVRDSLFASSMFELQDSKVNTINPTAARSIRGIGSQLENLARGDFEIPDGIRASYPTMCAFYSGDFIVKVEVDNGPKIGGRSQSTVTAYGLPVESRSGNLWEDMSNSPGQVVVDYNPHVVVDENQPGYRLQAVGYVDEEIMPATLSALDELASVVAHPPNDGDTSGQ